MKSHREFIRIEETVHWLDSPSQVNSARAALREAGLTFARIFRTPEDENHPDVYAGQKLIALPPEPPPPPAEGEEPTEPTSEEHSESSSEEHPEPSSEDHQGDLVDAEAETSETQSENHSDDSDAEEASAAVVVSEQAPVQSEEQPT